MSTEFKEIDKSMWQLDGSTDNCNVCNQFIQKGFLTSNKHHCRMCAKIVCSKCSKFKVSKKRICTSCLIQLYPDIKFLVSTYKSQHINVYTIINIYLNKCNKNVYKSISYINKYISDYVLTEIELNDAKCRTYDERTRSQERNKTPIIHDQEQFDIITDQSFNVSGLDSDVMESVCICGKCNYNHTVRLIKVMNKYSVNTLNVQNVNILQILNDFLHLLENHCNNQEFELIARSLKSCHAEKCGIFQRNFRNRSITTETTNSYTDAMVSILDKIHCFYQHCCGKRKILLKEWQIMNSLKVKTGANTCSNKRLIELKKIMSNQTTNSSIDLIKRRQQKFNQLNARADNRKMFNFGTAFKYGYYDKTVVADSLFVKPKYVSLKE
eukprot:182094_1